MDRDKILKFMAGPDYGLQLSPLGWKPKKTKLKETNTAILKVALKAPAIHPGHLGKCSRDARNVCRSQHCWTRP